MNFFLRSTAYSLIPGGKSLEEKGARGYANLAPANTYASLLHLFPQTLIPLPQTPPRPRNQISISDLICSTSLEVAESSRAVRRWGDGIGGHAAKAYVRRTLRGPSLV